MNFIFGVLTAVLVCLACWLSFTVCLTTDLGGYIPALVLTLIPIATFFVGLLVEANN